jgi:peptide/nickel transport system ATP-binding protein
VLADEPTTALDVVIQRGILTMLMRLQKQLQNTFIIVSHDMGVHYQITDRMVIMYAGKVAEIAPTEALFARPLHPYTEMLINALPRLGDDEQRVGISGRPPSLLNPPPGCRFADRCPLVTDRCREVVPPLVEVEPGRFAACIVRAPVDLEIPASGAAGKEWQRL